jgi:POT family proton-dependent oligopeptide transporter
VLVVLLLALFQFLAYDQSSNVAVIWIADHVDLTTRWGTVPVPWLIAEDSLASILVVPFLIALWRWQGRHGQEPHDMGKMAVGAVIMAASILAFAAGAWQADAGAKASILWPILGFMLSGISFMFSWPTMLALVSRRAPAGVNALLMSGVYITGFVTGIGSGWLARFYEPMGAWSFFVLHAGISLAGAVLLVTLGPAIRRRMDALDTAAGPVH